MNLPTTSDKSVSRKVRKTLFALLLGGCAGFLGAMGVMSLTDGEALIGFDRSREIASLVGMLYVFTGIAMGLGVASPRAGATFLNVEDAEELQEQRVMLGYSALGLIAFGLILPAAAFAAPVGPIPVTATMAVCAALLAISVVLSLATWRRQDELMRATGLEGAAMSFYLLLLVGGGWSLLAHLEQVQAPAPLDWLTMIWALVLLGCFVVMGRRGLLQMR